MMFRMTNRLTNRRAQLQTIAPHDELDGRPDWARSHAPHPARSSNLVRPQPDQLTRAVCNDARSDRLLNMWSPRQLKHDIWTLDDPNGPSGLSIRGKEY